LVRSADVRSTALGWADVRSTAVEGCEDRGEDVGAGAADRIRVAAVALGVARGEGRDHSGDALGVGCLRADRGVQRPDRRLALLVQPPRRRRCAVPQQRHDFLERAEPRQLGRVPPPVGEPPGRIEQRQLGLDHDLQRARAVRPPRPRRQPLDLLGVELGVVRATRRVALQQAAADVGVDRLALHAEAARDLLGAKPVDRVAHAVNADSGRASGPT
jgi:hypothetical protein